MMKQDSNPTTNNHPTATVCGHCGVEDRNLLHHVRTRGNFRRLCTTCVLRLHPQCFCPACLDLYDHTPPDNAVVCYKCYSASHPNCVPSPPAGTISSSRGPFICSSCLNPNLLVLKLDRVENGSRSGGRVIDCTAARLLLAAGKIAAMSMNKAEVTAAMEAERRAKEAAYTKKRAREALDHVVRLMGKEKIEKINKINSAGEFNSRKACMNVNGIDPVVVVDGGGNVVNKDDDSVEVLKALDAVELKDNGTLQVEKMVVESELELESESRVVVMEVDDGGKESGLNSIGVNGSVNNGDLVKIVENGEEQSLVEKNAGSNVD